MGPIKDTIGKVKANWIGGVAGGVVGFAAARKLYKGKYRMGVAVVGALVGASLGATAQHFIVGKKGAPTKKTVEAKA